MMAGSEKLFRDMLCESRSHPVESTDPNTARTIDELKRQLRETKAELEGERTKARLLTSQCEKDIKRVKDEADKKLSASLEALSIRKEQDRVTDIRRVEDRLAKERETELRTLEAKKNDELMRAQRKWNHDRDDEVRRAVREERERCYREVGVVSEEAGLKEDRLTRELFMLSQQNSVLEEQVMNLSRENRGQIDQLRRMKHEHNLEIADIVRQHQTEASRDYAQLRLAEQVLAEREQDLHIVENRVDRERQEREALAEEMVAMKSAVHNTSSQEHVTESPHSSRRSISGVLQRRLEDLEAIVKKLEEEKSNLKQDNASLRKKLVMDSPSVEGKAGAKDDEKTKKLRKRNTELVALVKTLDEKCKSLKLDYDRLKGGGSGMGEGEAAALRKALNRQHAKDISDYTKQIHGKDRELTELKKRLAKLEVNAKPPPEPVVELEKRIKVMAMDKLRMEKLISKLCTSSPPDEDSLTALSQAELVCESSAVEALDIENQSLKRQLAELQDSEQGSKVKDLQTEVERLAKFEAKVLSLQETLKETDSVKCELEQRCHSLSQQLQVSQLAVQELQEDREQVTQLEKEIERLTREEFEQQKHINTLEESVAGSERQQSETAQQIIELQSQIDGSTRLLREKDLMCQQLQDRLNTVPPSAEVGVQTINNLPPTSHVTSHSPISLVDSTAPIDTSLNCEMVQAGVEVTDPYDSSEANLSNISVESIDNDVGVAVGVASPIPEQVSLVEAVGKNEEKTDNIEPRVYIAKFSYNPAEQSPNPTHDTELPLEAGDLLFVYGSMDTDGFYQAKLRSGQSGIVPSNFVEPVEDEVDNAPSTRHSTGHSSRNLQDIQEVDEDLSSSDSLSELIAPTDLEIERQFAEEGGSSVALCWAPPPCHVTGYTLYMNGDQCTSVEGAENTTALLGKIPRNKLVKVTVRSVNGEGESPDNASPLVLNPQYPEPPGNVSISSLDHTPSLLVTFSPRPHTLTPVTHYTLYLNDHEVTQLEAIESTHPQQNLSALILPRDVVPLKPHLSMGNTLLLTVTANNDEYESIRSAPVGVATQLLTNLFAADDQNSEESKYSQAQREEDLERRQHMETNGDHVTNGTADSANDEQVRYYRALYSYNPDHQSPNTDLADEELTFAEGDIIKRIGNEDIDGFFEGHSSGRSGLVPGNMVEEITDPEELMQVQADTHHSNGVRKTTPPENSPRLLRAVHDYDASVDSPNDNSEVELTFSEGDLILVTGAPDSDGFYQGELGGKKGLVPMNFVEEAPLDTVMDKKTQLILANNNELASNLKHSD